MMRRWPIGRAMVVLHDLVMVLLAWQGLVVLRYASLGLPLPGHAFLAETAIVATVQLVVFWRMGLYRGLWRFASLPDLKNIVISSLVGGVAIALLLFLLLDRAEGVPRVALMLYPPTLVALLGGPRLLYRAWKDGLARRPDANRPAFHSESAVSGIVRGPRVREAASGGDESGV